MHDMVENVSFEGRLYKLLFLTNRQTSVLSSNETSIQRILEAFEVNSPKLVFNLLHSPGGAEWCGWASEFLCPFRSLDEQFENEVNLVELMSQVTEIALFISLSP